jgi:tetratricopeptide (TPR) repeat protein
VAAIAAEPVRNYSPEYIAALKEMVAAFNARDFDKAMIAIDKADAIRPPTTHTLNTRGAIYIEKKQFQKGVEYVKQALALDPKYFPALFNLAEVPLMQDRFAEARAMFQKLLDANPKDELVRYRVFLTHLLEKNDTAAREELGRIPFPGDLPAFYFANAAWEYAHGNAEEGKTWVTRGASIFGPERSQPFADPLIERGWVPRKEAGEMKAIADPTEPPAAPKPVEGFDATAPGLQLEQPAK